MSSTNCPVPLCHVDGFPVLGLLRGLCHLIVSSAEYFVSEILVYTVCVRCCHRSRSTQSGFPGSLDNTQAFSVRYDHVRTPLQLSVVPPSKSDNWLSDHLVDFRHLDLLPTALASSRLGHPHIFEVVTLEAVSVLTGMGANFFPRVLRSVSFGYHTKTLPSRTASTMKLRLFPTLLEERFCRLSYTLKDNLPPRYDDRPNGHGYY